MNSTKMTRNSKTRILFVITTIGIMLILFAYKSFRPISSLPNDDECIASFDTFAFTFPDINSPIQEVILPLSPWEPISESPEVETLHENRDYEKLEVVAVRQNDGNSEIWVSNPRSAEGFVYLVYFEDTEKWDQIPSEFGGEFPRIESLHISSGKSVWKVSLINGQIAFSVFDDLSKRFVEQGRVNIPYWRLNEKSRTYDAFDNIRTLWDVNDTLWIFSGNDAIYKFDPVTQQLNQLTSLEGYTTIGELAYDFRNEVFFDTYGSKRAVLQYNFTSDKLAIVSLPNMPVSTISLVDSTGNLWLRNSYGWKTPEGKWQRFHPNPINYWWRMDFLDDWVYYVPPDPVQQTSDGRIWFVINRSQEWKTLRSGIAWFDPNTKEGCWFTSEGAQIVEDNQQNLWIMVENTLYKYEYDS